MIQEVGHGSIPVLIAPSHREGVRSKSGLSFWKPSFLHSYPHTQTLPLSAIENPSIPLLCQATRAHVHGHTGSLYTEPSSFPGRPEKELWSSSKQTWVRIPVTLESRTSLPWSGPSFPGRYLEGPAQG